MRYAFLAAFVAFSAVHLYASLKCDKLLRGITKVFLIPALLGWYITSVAVPLKIVVAALVTSWLGDVLLMCGVVGFVIGGASFFLSHICFVRAYSMHVDMSIVPLWLVIIAALVYLVAVIASTRTLEGKTKYKFIYPGIIAYMTVNGVMNCYALFQLVTVPCLATAVMYVGAVSFFVSDAILFHVRFGHDWPFKTHFAVMLFYLLAEFLITTGFIMLAG